jgi:ribonucleoside-diphosphate reductase alpha chain
MTREKYYWLNEDSIKFLEQGYLREGQSPIDRIQEIANTAQKILGIEGFADKFIDYMSRGFYSLSTPVWMNFGNDRGNPISCFNSHIGDSVEDFLTKQAEVGMMTKVGGGTSGYFGDIRPRGSKISTGGVAEGSVRCMELFDNVAKIISQGSARRGSFAAYLPIDHGDFDEFMKIRSEGHSIQEMSIGVTIPDGWMQSMKDGDKEKRRRWAAVIKKRSETGYPYIFFTDNANKNAPQVYKDKGYKINASNLCSEIFLPSSKDESFVCCLSSLNLLWWDEIKETDAIETLVYFLDAVNEEFISKTKAKMSDSILMCNSIVVFHSSNRKITNKKGQLFMLPFCICNKPINRNQFFCLLSLLICANHHSICRQGFLSYPAPFAGGG